MRQKKLPARLEYATFIKKKLVKMSPQLFIALKIKKSIEKLMR